MFVCSLTWRHPAAARHTHRHRGGGSGDHNADCTPPWCWCAPQKLQHCHRCHRCHPCPSFWRVRPVHMSCDVQRTHWHRDIAGASSSSRMAVSLTVSERGCGDGVSSVWAPVSLLLVRVAAAELRQCPLMACLSLPIPETLEARNAGKFNIIIPLKKHQLPALRPAGRVRVCVCCCQQASSHKTMPRHRKITEMSFKESYLYNELNCRWYTASTCLHTSFCYAVQPAGLPH